MRSHYNNLVQNPTTPFWLRLIGRNLSLFIFLVLAVTGMMVVYWYFSPADGSAEAFAAVSEESSLSAPIFKSVPAKPVRQRLAQSPGPVRVGIISGHKGFDSGAVCDDGLTEATVNANIAERVATGLQTQGIRVDILEEFDPQLQNYSASALVSIHADSCSYINELATGFKISGSSYTDSSSLSICVENAYQEATQMRYHEHTVTADMADYHAFREIAPGVPAIIIEVGFMNLDREMLTANADVPASGLTNGILCFLNQN